MPTRRLLLSLPPATLLAACSPTGALNALAPSDTYQLRADLVYGAHPRQRIDAYLPAQTTAVPPAGWPVVLFFYGGSWRSGSRDAYRFVGEALASQGILTLLADYRLYPEVRYPDFLHDCAAALAWVRRSAASFGGDPQRLHVMGHSAGAYNAAMLALDARWLGRQGLSPQVLAGWIGLAGPYDFLPIVNTDVQPVFHHPAYPKDSQPILYVRAGAPRTFLGAPVDDTLVHPRRNTVQLATRLRDAGVTVVSRLYEGTSHASLIGAFGRPLRGLAPVLDDVADFVRASA
jgi:acetyl esterase/lipase